MNQKRGKSPQFLFKKRRAQFEFYQNPLKIESLLLAKSVKGEIQIDDEFKKDLERDFDINGFWAL